MARWKPGQSGNPKGKPPGALHRATRAAQALLDGEAEALTRRCVEAALGGDMIAMRLCLERLIPPVRHRAVRVALPPLRGLSDLPAALQAVATAVGEGEITPQEGEALVAVLEAYRKGLEVADLERRLTALEERLTGGQPREPKS